MYWCSIHLGHSPVPIMAEGPSQAASQYIRHVGEGLKAGEYLVFVASSAPKPAEFYRFHVALSYEPVIKTTLDRTYGDGIPK